MQALTLWKIIANDYSNLFENLIGLLKEQDIPFCLMGGQAVNVYAEPLISRELNLVVAVGQIDKVEVLFEKHFILKRFSHSLNVTIPDSDVRVQIQTDKRYGSFLERAVLRSVLGMTLPVASVEDVLQGKIWAALDSARRGSKRQKDLADIARILENYPQYRSLVPKEILERLLDYISYSIKTKFCKRGSDNFLVCLIS